MYFSVENIGTTSVVIPNPCGCSPLQAFGVFGENCPTPLPPECVPPLHWYPADHFFFGTPITVAPGQCIAYTRTWSGVPDFAETAPPGAYVVAVGMSALVRTFFMPDQGVRLPISIVSSTVGIPAGTWGKVKILYR